MAEEIDTGDRARLQTLDAMLADATKAHESARIAHAKYCAYLEVKYDLRTGDTLDLKTGVITRNGHG